jgi:hypothetical protein
MTNVYTQIDGSTSSVTLAAADIVKSNGTGGIAKVAANASTVGLGIVYSGATSGKPVSFVRTGKVKAYVDVATDGTAIEVGTPLIIGTGSTRGAGQVFVSATSTAAANTVVARALTAVAVNTAAEQEVLIDVLVDFE